MLIGIVASVPASSYARVQRQRGVARAAARDPGSLPAVLIEPSAPIVNLFARAEEGIQRTDWKFAIDCLQRIVDDAEGSLVPRAGVNGEQIRLYETASRRAVRRLASLPPAGLRAYRLLYNGRARRLYESGKAAHDPNTLRVVANRYLLSEFGDDAVDLLASWALDEGRPGEAVVLLIDLLELVPQRDLPTPLIIAKLATAYAMLGRLDEAAGLLTHELVIEMGEEGAEGRRDEGTKGAERGRYAADIAAATATALSDFVPREFQTGISTTQWPIVGGSLGRQGRQPAVQPTLVDRVPWRFDARGAESGEPRVADAWRRVFGHDPDEALWLPVAQLVAADERLFLRTRRGCVALDMADLGLVWEAQDPGWRIEVRQPSPLRRARGRVTKPPPRRIADFEDFVHGAVSVQAGLVLTVARGGQATYTHSAVDPGGRPAVIWQASTPPSAPTAAAPRLLGTRLVAYDAATGAFRWQRGRTGDPSDPLGDADFRSAPIEVNGALWVPFFRQADFYVGILDPVRGGLIRTILLCSTNDSKFSRRLSLSPTSLDGIVYVPSGHGVLFAIDAHEHTLRWASQYADGLGSRRGEGMPGPGWQPSPPIVSGGMVLLAPSEHDELLALSASNGELRWSKAREDFSYLIAADYDRVWVGGRRISCLSSSDGRELWSAHAPSAPTGRAALSGNTVYVPLLDGLLSLDAVTGEPVEYASFAAHEEPLGNLLFLGTAMFVVNPSSVRKFPDIDQSYLILQAEHEADPANPAIAVRLSWLMLLQGGAGDAYAMLKTIPVPWLEADPQRAGEVARLRVECLLVMGARAAESDETAGEALALLEEAQETARSAHDRLRCRLAVAHRLDAMGRRAEAYRQLWDLGLSADAQQVVPQAEFVVGLARYDIARRLHRIEPQMTEPQRRTLRAHRAEWTDAAVAHLAEEDTDHGEGPQSGAAKPLCGAAVAARSRLEAMVDLEPDGSIRQHALLELAAHYARHLRYEPAEQLLRESVRVDADPSLTIAGLMQTSRMYARTRARGIECSVALLNSLGELESRLEIAAAMKHGDGGTEGRRDEGDAGRGAGLGDSPSATGPSERRIQLDGYDSMLDWVEAMRLTVPEALRHAFGEASVDAPIRLTTETAWSLHWDHRDPPLQLIAFGEHAPALLSKRVLLYGPGETVSCYDASGGDLLWQTDLRLPGTFPDRVGSPRLASVDARRFAVADGQTAVFSGSQGLFAIGLITGRRLWVKPYELAGEANAPFNRDKRMAAGDGLLAAIPNAGRLTLMRIRDGTTVWERDLRDEPVAHVRMVHDRIVTMDARLERVNFFDRDTGEWLNRVLFEQPDPEGGLLDLVFTGDVLIGPVSTVDSESILGVDLASGTPLWQIQLDKPLVQLLKPAEGYVGMGLLGGELRIVHAATGDQLPAWRIAGTRKVVGGALVDGTVVVQYVSEREGASYLRLAGLDLATGKQLWRRDDVKSFRRTSTILPVFGGQVPVLITSTEAPKRKRKTYLTMIDVRTGDNVGLPVPPSGTSTHQIRHGFDVLPVGGVLVMAMDSAIHVMKIETSSPPSSLRPSVPSSLSPSDQADRG